jgi:hypothetical protein
VEPSHEATQSLAETQEAEREVLNERFGLGEDTTCHDPPSHISIEGWENLRQLVAMDDVEAASSDLYGLVP